MMRTFETGVVVKEEEGGGEKVLMARDPKNGKQIRFGKVKDGMCRDSPKSNTNPP